jgi:hypothetical protein
MFDRSKPSKAERGVQEAPISSGLGVDAKHRLDHLGLEVRRDRTIYAAQDERGLYVYQAFCPHIAKHALEKGTFGEGFGMRRMTWIKPSFGWMLHRSHFGESRNQEVILRIKISHEGFGTLLRESALASFDPDVYPSQSDWRKRLSDAHARVQWDPDRNLACNQIVARRAIQVGIGAELMRDYVDTWILSLEDVTAVAKSVQRMIQSGCPADKLPHPYLEREYPVDSEIMVRLGMAVPRKLSAP